MSSRFLLGSSRRRKVSRWHLKDGWKFQKSIRIFYYASIHSVPACALLWKPYPVGTFRVDITPPAGHFYNNKFLNREQLHQFEHHLILWKLIQNMYRISQNNTMTHQHIQISHEIIQQHNHSDYQLGFTARGVRYNYESNGTIIFDLEWPWKVKFKVIHILKSYISQINRVRPCVTHNHWSVGSPVSPSDLT